MLIEVNHTYGNLIEAKLSADVALAIMEALDSSPDLALYAQCFSLALCQEMPEEPQLLEVKL